jgi:hypothetical protein
MFIHQKHSGRPFTWKPRQPSPMPKTGSAAIFDAHNTPGAHVQRDPMSASGQTSSIMLRQFRLVLSRVLRHTRQEKKINAFSWALGVRQRSSSDSGARGHRNTRRRSYFNSEKSVSIVSWANLTTCTRIHIAGQKPLPENGYTSPCAHLDIEKNDV